MSPGRGVILILIAHGNMRSNGIKLKGRRYRLDIRKNFLTVRVIELNRLPRERCSDNAREAEKGNGEKRRAKIAFVDCT
ncbi:unnamed protein product [Ranitomeya imitator]|uniref:Uncharacterized protein n=1 Tax=Ranitomeya imitator TaxID=111125 RepID=A0ABN9MNJ7_9NEOB|nr:unnamed protein product [Ranitomeya imitator]